MDATHILDGQLLIQRVDALGRNYYTDQKNRRVSTAGRQPDPYVGGENEEAGEADGSEIFERDLTAVSFLGVGVAISAIISSHGYHEAGGFCANRCGERAAILSAPQGDGGHRRYRVEFPEVLHLALEEAA